MLLGFRVSNYRSFRDEVQISFVATRLDRGYGFPVQISQDGSTEEVLPIAAILGANASGKSNLLRAMSFMRTAVLESATRSRRAGPLGDPFALDPNSLEKPTLMELDFALRGVRYQYGFELHKGRFLEEWLLTYPHKRSQTLFDRENGSEYSFGKALHGQNRAITDITRPEVLYLSSAAQAGHDFLTQIYNFFEFNLALLDVPDRTEASPAVVRRLAERSQNALNLIAKADLGILDASVREASISNKEWSEIRNMVEAAIPNLPDDPGERERAIETYAREIIDVQPTVELLHRSNKKGVALPFAEESLGTRSWLSFVSHALDALEQGSCLLVDELDASLHPFLLAEAMQLFQSETSNRHGAQLIFTTHDVTLLDNSFDRFKLARGQVWLVEKDDAGVSSLTALSDYRPRKGEDLARGYLQGRYGGTPRVANRQGSDLRSGTAIARRKA